MNEHDSSAHATTHSGQQPQNRIQMGGIPKPGQSFNMTMDDKNLTIENLGADGLRCHLGSQGMPSEIIPIRTGITTLWQDGPDNRIECCLQEDGRMEFLSFKPTAQNTSFVAASTGGKGQSWANPFGNGFPFNKRK
ncbi:MAG: hypothetical protein G8345_17920 [Magnetococcales bacterium]|nr:hypothetical protein [Magnetococcales bacterium]